MELKIDLCLCSLSDLCNFAGVDYESDNDSDEWQSTTRRTASLSSDMSALSCVSVLPAEELDRLLEDVRSLGDSTLQVPSAGHMLPFSYQNLTALKLLSRCRCGTNISPSQFLFFSPFPLYRTIMMFKWWFSIRRWEWD